MKALLITAASLIFATGANAEEYLLGVDSLPQEGVPEGTVTKHAWDASRIYPGTTHEYWVYVPAQYTEAEPAAVMVFQDGQGYASREGTVRAPTVFDNLIHKGEVPVTIGIFLNPGKKEQAKDQRGTQYVPINDTYARFLLEEILPEVGKDYNLVEDAAGRARTNVFGKDRHSVLTVVSEEGALAATIDDDEDGEIEVTGVHFEDGILSDQYAEPKSSWRWAQSKAKAKSRGEEWTGTMGMGVWLKVTGDTFEGAVSRVDKVADNPMKGRRRGAKP